MDIQQNMQRFEAAMQEAFDYMPERNPFAEVVPHAEEAYQSGRDCDRFMGWCLSTQNLDAKHVGTVRYLPEDCAPTVDWEDAAPKIGTKLYVPATSPAASSAQPFQARVHPWMLACFGAAIAADAVERNHRFFEEAAELVQACGMTASEAHQLVDYTWSRPIGEKQQEVGGVMVTLAALCLASELDMHAAGETELARISAPETMTKIRAKQAAKPKHSPLPEASAQDVARLLQTSHPDDEAVDRFADAMKEKMTASRAKGRSGWQQCAPADLSHMLREHVAKGDPRDVANFCMMLWHHGSPVLETAPTMVWCDENALRLACEKKINLEFDGNYVTASHGEIEVTREMAEDDSVAATREAVCLVAANMEKAAT